MRLNKFPSGWNEEQVQRVLAHYERQTDEEAVAEDEAAYEDSGDTLMEIPYELAMASRMAWIFSGINRLLPQSPLHPK